VVRASCKLELGGLLESNQGTGTFIRVLEFEGSEQERARQLTQIVRESAARAGAAGFTVEDLIEGLRELADRPARRR